MLSAVVSFASQPSPQRRDLERDLNFIQRNTSNPHQVELLRKRAIKLYKHPRTLTGGPSVQHILMVIGDIRTKISDVVPPDGSNDPNIPDHERFHDILRDGATELNSQTKRSPRRIEEDKRKEETAVRLDRDGVEEAIRNLPPPPVTAPAMVSAPAVPIVTVSPPITATVIAPPPLPPPSSATTLASVPPSLPPPPGTTATTAPPALPSPGATTGVQIYQMDHHDKDPFIISENYTYYRELAWHLRVYGLVSKPDLWKRLPAQHGLGNTGCKWKFAKGPKRIDSLVLDVVNMNYRKSDSYIIALVDELGGKENPVPLDVIPFYDIDDQTKWCCRPLCGNIEQHLSRLWPRRRIIDVKLLDIPSASVRDVAFHTNRYPSRTNPLYVLCRPKTPVGPPP